MKLAFEKCESNDLEIEAVKKLLIELKYQSAAKFLMAYNDEVEEEIIDKVSLYLDKQIPVQYILGYTYFYGLKFRVNDSVLIPRYDTEVLVEEAIKEIKANDYKRCLDLCTGSGAIAISVCKNTDAKVYASDISKDALDVAIRNNHEIGTSVEFIESDILTNIDYQFDIILSNPPYISYNEDVDKIVRENEPHLALFAKEDGLYFYRKILEEIKEKQKNIKMIIFEIGYKQADEIAKITNNIFSNASIVVIKDYAGRDRVLKISL